MRSRKKKRRCSIWVKILYFILLAGLCIGGYIFYNNSGKNVEKVAEENGYEKKDNVDDIDAVSISEMSVGSVISSENIAQTDLSSYFQAFPIVEGDEIYQRIINKSYRKNQDIALSDLRYLKLLHYNFEHKIQVGELIVNQEIVPDVIDIFMKLFQKEYEIQSMYLVDNYWPENAGGKDWNTLANKADYNSIEVNNTSAFNYRMQTGGEKLSRHAMGCAVDLNPQQNPYVLKGKCAHQNAYVYMNREIDDSHVIKTGDFCYSLFVEKGFEWGGEWKSLKDYQHFEKNR